MDEKLKFLLSQLKGQQVAGGRLNQGLEPSTRDPSERELLDVGPNSFMENQIQEHMDNSRETESYDPSLGRVRGKNNPLHPKYNVRDAYKTSQLAPEQAAQIAGIMDAVPQRQNLSDIIANDPMTQKLIEGSMGVSGGVKKLGQEAAPVAQGVAEQVKRILYKLKKRGDELKLESDVGRASGQFIGNDPSNLEVLAGKEALDLGHENPFYLHGLEVKPELQGGGYGSKMFKTMEDKARREGADSIILNASPMGTNLQPRDASKLPQLVEFYKRLGLQPYLDEGSNVMMHKKLNK